MGMDVYTKSYWAAIKNGEFAEANRLYEEFCATPTARQIESSEEDWELFHEYNRLNAELDLKYGHFRWASQFRMLTGFSPDGEDYKFTALQAKAWAELAATAWATRPYVKVKNGHGETLYEGVMVNDDEDYPVVMTKRDVEALKALAALDEGGYIA
jgi:hypothetical protein